MKNFKDGDFVVSHDRSTLFIFENKHMHFIRNILGLFSSSKLDYTCSPVMSDNFATKADIDSIMQGAPMPQWANDILKDAGRLPYGPVSSINPVPPSCPVALPEQVKASLGLSSVPAEPKAMLTPLMMLRANCPHQWKTYVGFSAIFEYCELCEDKR